MLINSDIQGKCGLSFHLGLGNGHKYRKADLWYKTTQVS